MGRKGGRRGGWGYGYAYGFSPHLLCVDTFKFPIYMVLGILKNIYFNHFGKEEGFLGDGKGV